jgi:hypothetical protein
VLPTSPRFADHRHLGRDLADVRDQALELVLGALRGEVGDLRLERDHQIAGRVDDGRAEVEDACRVVLPRAGELAGLGVEPDAQQRIVRAFGGGQLVGEACAHRVGGVWRRASAAAAPV